MDGKSPSGFDGAYSGMIKEAVPVVTKGDATETDKKTCKTITGCVCGTLLGCLIKADGNIELFF